MGTSVQPSIEISIEEDGSGHRISVRDNGVGIDPTHHGKIFELFQSLGPRKSGTGTGTGIGLAVVRKIAEAHGGRAWVESDPGQGSSFHVTFSSI
jgi:signal transduction histidine kinase